MSCDAKLLKLPGRPFGESEGNVGSDGLGVHRVCGSRESEASHKELSVFWYNGFTVCYMVSVLFKYSITLIFYNKLSSNKFFKAHV